MNYQATNFLTAGDLPDRVRSLLDDYFDRSPAGTPKSWTDLTTGHDDQAAAVLALLRSLSRVTAVLEGRTAGGLEMVAGLQLLAGDRVYARLDRDLFLNWRAAGGKFTIALEGDRTETGKVRFNRGGFGGSLHEGFDIQGVTSNSKVPRLQWNYRFCDSLADIDLDGYRPFDFIHHLTYANSDSRQWYDKYQEKFGNAGFDVEKVGNVPELKVRNTSECPAPEARLTGEEAAAARDLTLRFGRRISADRGFEPALTNFFVDDFANRVLRDEWASPLEPDVARAAIRDSTADDLEGYYLARNTLFYQERSAAVLESAGPILDRLRAELVWPGENDVIETSDELAAERARLESAVHRVAAESIAADEAGEPTPVRGDTPPIRTWLSVSDTEAFGFAPGTRFVVANLPYIQLLMVRERDEFRVLSVVPGGRA
jgi:hypothetical protein